VRPALIPKTCGTRDDGVVTLKRSVRLQRHRGPAMLTNGISILVVSWAQGAGQRRLPDGQAECDADGGADREKDQDANRRSARRREPRGRQDF